MYTYFHIYFSFTVYFRCKNCLRSGRKDMIDITVDGGKWYERKKQGSASNSASTVIPPVTGWKGLLNNTAAIPHLFNFGNVYHWMVESLPSLPDSDSSDDEDDNTTVATEKQLKRGRQYMYAIWSCG